jgi:hypothetical protein
MSLDIYINEARESKEFCECECGHIHERNYQKQIKHLNVTHNLVQMANALGVYDIIWRPEENGITECRQLIEHLEIAFKKMKANPQEYKKYEPSNGWGSLLTFESFLYEYIEVCKENPEALIKVDR